MASVERYIVERGADQVPMAFRGMVTLAKDNGIANITLVVPKKAGWEHSIIGEFLGQAVAKALIKGQSVRLEGVTVSLESPQTFRPIPGQGLLVGAHISVKDMGKLEDAWGTQILVYLPWNDLEAQEWKATWYPQTIGSKSEEAQTSSLSVPVEEALKRLTDMINLGTGLGHPSDKRHAQKTFDKLLT